MTGREFRSDIYLDQSRGGGRARGGACWAHGKCVGGPKRWGARAEERAVRGPEGRGLGAGAGRAGAGAGRGGSPPGGSSAASDVRAPSPAVSPDEQGPHGAPWSSRMRL